MKLHKCHKFLGSTRRVCQGFAKTCKCSYIWSVWCSMSRMGHRRLSKIPRSTLQGKDLNTSMTSPLTHTVAHSTRPFFRLKINIHPLKKACGQLSKSCQKGKILTFKVNFLWGPFIYYVITCRGGGGSENSKY